MSAYTNSIYATKLKDEQAVKLLCFYAYTGSCVFKEEMDNYISCEKIQKNEMLKTARMLYENNLLRLGDFDWRIHDLTYRIGAEHYLPVMQLLYNDHPEWLRFFERHYRINNPNFRILKDMAILALRQKSDQIPGKWFVPEMMPYLIPVAIDPQLMSIALRMPNSYFRSFFEKAIVYLHENDITDDGGIMAKLLEEVNISSVQLTELKEMLALYRYFSHGEYTPPAEKPDTLYSLLLEAVHTAYNGQYVRAIQYFEAAMKIRNKEATEKNILEGMIICYILVMTYIHEDSPESKAKLLTFFKKKTVEKSDSLLPARTIGYAFLDPERRLSPFMEESLLNYQSVRTARCFGFLFARYFRVSTKTEMIAKDYMPQQAILRHELSPYLPLTDEEREELWKKFGRTPLLTSIHRKETWELILENLLKETEKDTQNNEKGRSANMRMAYFIRYGNNVEVREQSILKSGQWSTGRVISSVRYQGGNLEFMDEADKKIWTRWNSKRHYDVYIEDVLPELVGSDRVYTGAHAPYQQVVITKEKPYLIVEKGTKGRLKISSNFSDDKLKRYDAKDHVIVQKDETHYVVIPMEGKQRRCYSQLLSLEELPQEAEKRLQEFFLKMSDVLEVHSSIIKGGSTLETIDGQSTICLQIRPSYGMYDIQIFAKPILEGTTLLQPGKGIGLTIDEIKDKRYQVKRHLAKEQSNYEALAYYLEETFDVVVRDYAVSLNPEQMLTLLDYLYPLSDTYIVEWPEGEKIHLRDVPQSANWNISLKGKGNWLEMEGDVQLDDDLVISMSKLLEYVGQSRSRFIRLNETDYLRLSDSLRKQLNRLESVAVKDHGKMKISNFQAGLLGDDVLNGEIKIKHDAALDRIRKKIANSQQLIIRTPSKLNAELRDYQKEGLRWIARLNYWGAGACLADDMGLGKTIQTIAYLLYTAKEGASLVVAPASVVPNWKRELQRFAPSLNVLIVNESINRKQTVEQAGKFDVVLSTYGILVSESELLTAKEWNVVCLDEAHTIKNRETKTSSCAMQLKASKRLILTGTPIQNHLGELWNLFQFINPGLLGNYEQFLQKYILPIEQDHDKQRQLQLNRIVHPFMLRRTKQEVVEELPDKQEIILPIDLSEDEMRIYEVIRRKAQEMLKEEDNNINVNALSEITKLRQAACSASLVEKKWKGECSKINILIELLTELKSGGNRALIFSQFTSFLALVKEALDKADEEYLYLDGSTPVKRRDQLVQDFQQGECPFFLISLKAGGLGLNLTGANYIIHLDPWWNPAIEQQATDRAYRIGQEQKVTAYHLIATHTIEEKIMRLHDTKRNLADALLEGTDMSHKMTAQELLEMLDNQ